MPTITIIVPDDVIREIDAEASKANTTRAKHTAHLVMSALEQKAAAPAAAEQLNAAQAALNEARLQMDSLKVEMERVRAEAEKMIRERTAAVVAATSSPAPASAPQEQGIFERLLSFGKKKA